MEKIRFGLIGCGKMMTQNHTPSLKKLMREGQPFTVNAVCDVIEERANALAQEFDAKAYTDYKAMVDDVDAVLIATSHEWHYDIAHFFMTNDKHVLLEKPICNTREQCVSLIETSKKHDITFQCAYPVPYWEGVEMLKEMLDSGLYGNINQMSIWTEQFTKPVREGELVLAEQLGGGQLFSHGCHYIDILLDFLGDPLQGVHMGTNTCTPWMEKEGNSNVIMTFKNGTMGYHYGTWGARGTTHGYTFHVHTDKGMFEYLDGKEATLKFTSNIHPDPDQRKETIWKLGSTEGHATWREIKHFLHCVEHHEVPRTNAERALRSLDVIWALYDAEEKNQIADLSNI